MRFESFKEKTVGFVMIAGVAIVIIALIALAMFAGGGVLHGTATRDPFTNEIHDAGDLNLVPLAFLAFAVGLTMILGGIGYGLWANHTRHTGVRVMHEHARILARYGYTKDWHMITADWELEQADNPRYYVRLQLPTGEIAEFECSPETYFACGEGMTGSAETEGKWLGLFHPYIGVPGA